MVSRDFFLLSFCGDEYWALVSIRNSTGSPSTDMSTLGLGRGSELWPHHSCSEILGPSLRALSCPVSHLPMVGTLILGQLLLALSPVSLSLWSLISVPLLLHLHFFLQTPLSSEFPSNIRDSLTCLLILWGCRGSMGLYIL